MFTPTVTGRRADRNHDSTRSDPAGDTNFASPPGPSTSTPVDQNSVPKPLAAKMGTFKWDGFSQWLIQMGEMPNVYWTHADPPTVFSPFQLRGTPKTDGIKPLLERRGKGYSPPKIKITKRSNLFHINEKLKRHIKDHGMYTITCLPDPRDPTKMVSVLDHGSLFTVAEANKAVQPYLTRWDDYDKGNDADCKVLLESLMDTTLWDELKGREDSPFCVLYIELCSLLQPKSKDYFDGISKQLKELKPSQFPGEDITLYTTQAMLLYDDLKHSGYIAMDHFQYLLHGLANANGVAVTVENNAWKQPFLQYLATFTECEKKARHLDKTSDKLKVLSDNGIRFLQICQEADSLYQSEKQAGRWAPAISSVDKAKVPAKFQANLLQPATTNGNSQSSNLPGNCHICGKPGHWARSCPQKQTQSTGNHSNGQQGNRSGNNYRRNNRGGLRPNGSTSRNNNRNRGAPRGGPRNGNRGNNQRSNSSGEPSWRKTYKGDSVTHNGRTFYWCQHCNDGKGKYSTNHNTDGHTGKKAQANAAEASPNPSPPQANAAYEAAAWNVIASTENSPMEHESTSLFPLGKDSSSSSKLPPCAWHADLHGSQPLVQLLSLFNNLGFGLLLVLNLLLHWDLLLSQWAPMVTTVQCWLSSLPQQLSAGWSSLSLPSSNTWPQFLGAQAHLLQSFGLYICKLAVQHPLIVLAPILWSLLLLVPLVISWYAQHDPPLSRGARRRLYQHYHRQSRRKPKPRGLRAHGVHRRYPFRLRDTWKFLWRPKTAAHRDLNQLESAVYDFRNGTTPVTHRQYKPSRRGGSWRNKGPSNRWNYHRGSKFRPGSSQLRPTDPSVSLPPAHQIGPNCHYIPVPAHPRHGFGNLGRTRLQIRSQNLRRVFVRNSLRQLSRGHYTTVPDT